MHDIIDELLKNGQPVIPTKGRNVEVIGVTLELTNPRARLSRSSARGKLFSCVGELAWYMRGSNEADVIAYYIPEYANSAQEGVLRGAYGPRLFGAAQSVHGIIDLLTAKPSTRRAVIPIISVQDLSNDSLDVPCTCLLQFFLRDDLLDVVVYMRSNDVIRGFVHDVFAFTMIQELVARGVGVEVGRYIHMVGSMHLYDADRAAAEAYLIEGWHEPGAVMLAMPQGTPFEDIDQFLAREESIRLGSPSALKVRELGDGFWDDLVRVLLVHNALASNSQGIEEIRSSLANGSYQIYLSDRQVRSEKRLGKN